MGSTESADSDRRGRDRRLISRYLEDARRLSALREAGVRPESNELEHALGSLSNERVRDLVEPHLFYVIQVATEYTSRDLSFEDVVAEGNMGLVEAAHHYDPEHGVKFLTYASWWIRKRILEYLVNEGQSVRLTRYAREQRRDLRQVRDRMRQTLGRDPSVEELARETGLDEVTVIERSGGANPVVFSIEQPVDQEGGVTLRESLPSRHERSPEDIVVLRGIRDLVHEEVARLSERERLIIENRFSFGGQDAMTFQEIGQKLGLSRERARQIEREALVRLRRRLAHRVRIGAPKRSHRARKAE